MGKKHYNNEFRESAVKWVLEQGYTAKKAAESLGVHPTTVKGWVLDYRSEHGTPKVLEQVDQRRRFMSGPCMPSSAACTVHRAYSANCVRNRWPSVRTP